MYRFAIIGNDARMESVKSALLYEGFEITSPNECDAVILPIGFENAAQFNGKTIFAPFDTGLENSYNYLENDYFKTLNAIPSAEGAIMLAMQNSQRTLWGSRAAVVGYGCIGTVLCSRLSALGAHVTLYARGETALAKARRDGVQAMHISLLPTAKCDTLFNTVPAPVIDRAVLLSFSRPPFIIDLASRPGGVDFAAADELGIKYIHALSLPAKCAPVTAGEILKDTVISILRGVK